MGGERWRSKIEKYSGNVNLNVNVPCKKCQLSALGLGLGMAHFRKSVPGQVLVSFMCCECQFWDTIINFLFLINSSSNPHRDHHSMIHANHRELRLEKLSD